MTRTRGTFIKGKIAVLMAVVMVFGALGLSNAIVYGATGQPNRRTTVTVDGVVSTHDLVLGTNSLNASGIDFTIENEANTFVIYLGAVRVTGNTTARTSTTINGRRVEIVVNTERNSGGQRADSQPTAASTTAPAVSPALPIATPTTNPTQGQIPQAPLPTTPSGDIDWLSTLHPSSITLPNRRLTERERGEWIADYWYNGGHNAFELEVIRLVNEIRAEHGLSELELDISLMLSARFYTQTLNNLGLRLGHNRGPYATNPNAQHGASANVARIFGANLRWGGGNAAGNFRSPQATVDAWMSSDGHRRYILSSEHNLIGIGAYCGFRYLFLSELAGNR